MRLLKDGAVQTWTADEDGKTVYRRTQDCTPIVEQCAQLRSAGAGTSPTGDGHWAGRIPAVEVERYMNEHGVTFAEFIGNPVHVQRYMNDPDNKLLRIWSGRL